MSMRKRADWMTIATDPILELLVETDLALPSGVIHYNLDRKTGNGPARSTVNRTIKILEAYEMVQKPPDSKTYYEATERARQYLEGELDASQLEPE